MWDISEVVEYGKLMKWPRENLKKGLFTSVFSCRDYEEPDLKNI